jgi:hypothetical protein
VKLNQRSAPLPQLLPNLDKSLDDGRGAKQVYQLYSGAPAVVKDFVRKVVQLVVVHSNRIAVEVSKKKLRCAFIGEPHASSHQPVPWQMQQDSNDVIRLEIEAQVNLVSGSHSRAKGATRLLLSALDRDASVFRNNWTSLKAEV